MRSSGTKVAISTTGISENESMTSPSESKKSQRRISNGARVMFREPSWSRTDETHESSVPLLQISSKNDPQLRDKVEATSDVPLNEDIVEDSMKRAMYLGEVESGLHRATTGTSAATSGTRTRFSENIGVQSMVFDPPQTDRLPILEATAFAVILREALDSFDILERIIPVPVDERWDDSYRTIDERYGRPEKPRSVFSDEDTSLLPRIPTVSRKIQRDRTYIYNVVKSTVRDIECLRRYDRLEVEVDDIVRILEGEHGLEINHEIWTGQVKQLRELIESDRLENEEETCNFRASTRRINTEVDNVIFLDGSKLGYVEQWEEARLEQRKLGLEYKEQESNEALGECERMETAERIVSGEVRTFLQISTKDLEAETVAWTSRCNEEVERLEREINDTKEKIEFQKLELRNLRELHRERQAFVDECCEEKERIARDIEYRDAVNNAATVVQSAWRGYIVRHQLGRYNNLWANLKKRKRRAAVLRKKNEEWKKKRAIEWGATDLKKLKNIVDPNA